MISGHLLILCRVSFLKVNGHAVSLLWFCGNSIGDGQAPVHPSSPFLTASGVLYHSGSTVDVDTVDVEVVFNEVDFVVCILCACLAVFFRLVFFVDVDVEVDKVGVEVVVVVVEVNVSLDVLAFGIAVRNRIAELIVWNSDIEVWAFPWKYFSRIQLWSIVDHNWWPISYGLKAFGHLVWTYDLFDNMKASKLE